MSDSILTSTKKALGITEDDTSFDVDILMHINSVFFTLSQLGIGPPGGYAIEDATTTWDHFLGTDLNLNAVKSYMYLKVRLMFDPPATSYLISSMERQVQELEWRLNAYRESTEWTAPVSLLEDPVAVIDGGGA